MPIIAKPMPIIAKTHANNNKEKLKKNQAKL
jgi:hypothetical protein